MTRVLDSGYEVAARRGAAAATLQQVVDETGARAVFWNRRYDEAGIAADREIKADLRAQGLYVATFNAALLTEPWQQKTGSGSYYRVFTPFWKSVRASFAAPRVLSA